MTAGSITPDQFIFQDSRKRLYQDRLCLIPNGGNVPGHPCIGPNRILNFDGFLSVVELIEQIKVTGQKPETVTFSEIWQQSHFENEREVLIESERYQVAETSYPGIISPIRNPGDKPYRMLDGRRRLWKQEASGATDGLFYIIPETEVFKFFWMVLSLETLRPLVE
jgi:hypothetical protein